eukprot:m.435924 g.435924  ORF g.435924 m.435924 type:complete len:82 (+) comp17912_c0_seq1:2897-3142(+)
MAGADQRELQQFVMEQRQKVETQTIIAGITDVCFEKCCASPGSKVIGPSGDTRTEQCLKNCAERFIESSNFIITRMSQKGH